MLMSVRLFTVFTAVVPVEATYTAEVTLQPLPSVTETVYLPLVVNTYTDPVAPGIATPFKYHW